jgi:ribosomal protein S18 acetylase RimI-like enzyme
MTDPVLVIRAFQPDDKQAVVELWRQCGLVHPANDPIKDISRKQKVRGDLFLVGELDREIIASVMAGYDGHRGWIYYVGVSPRHQKRGFGRRMIAEAERLLRVEGCAKINLQVRKANAGAMAFYASVGFMQDEVASFGKRLEHDEGKS